MYLYVLTIFKRCHKNKINNKFENLKTLSLKRDILMLFIKATNCLEL